LGVAAEAAIRDARCNEPRILFAQRFFPGTLAQSQKPIGAIEGHLSYDLKQCLGVTLDSNYWYGGRVAVNGVENT
jgi:hypothetical protein